MEGTIEIDTSQEALKERLDLCKLRTDAYFEQQEGTKLPEELKGFFDTAFLLLREAAFGEKREQPEEDGAGRFSGLPLSCEVPPEMSGEEKLLGRLRRFWLCELSGISRLTEGGSPEVLAAAWETTLQMLAECNDVFGTGSEVLFSEKENREDPGDAALSLKNIVYSYLYDDAETFLSAYEEAKKQHRPLPQLFICRLVYHPQELLLLENGLELFYGDRLKARLLGLRSVPGVPYGAVEPVPGVPSGADVPDIGQLSLSAHQKKSLKQLYRGLGLLALALALTACGGDGAETEGEETTAAEAFDEAYPSTVTAMPEGQESEEHFGVMHARVLDVQEGEKDGLFVYTLRDDEDPENAWCLNSQDIGTVVCEMSAGKKITALFSGDIIGDPDGVSFIALLDDAGYTIKKVEGTTISNMMSSFIIRTTKGVEMTFVKDNCRVDRDALSTDGNGKILVYYADCGNVDLYPVRIYSTGK